MRTTSIILVLLLGTMILAAQPKLGVYVDGANGAKQALGIQSMHLSVQIVGRIATTTVDMVVKNDAPRQLDGEYVFPLQDGQTISRFALDINGKLREGVVVEKAQGRIAYESTIRQKIDPALLEWTRGNAFRTRIYPLPARGTRHIVIAYEQELIPGSTGLSYQSPFAFAERVDTFHFTAEVLATDSRPTLNGGTEAQPTFQVKGRSYLAELHETNIALERPFLISVPVTLGRPYVVTNILDGTTYFASFLRPRFAAKRRSTPFTMALIWDVSASAKGRAITREIELLHSIFSTMTDGSIDLYTIDIRRAFVHRYTLTRGACPDLEKALTAQHFDGATQLGALDLASLKHDVIFLCSDGISTFGSHAFTKANAPVIGITSAAQADHDVLRSICLNSKGTLLDLTRISVSDATTKFWEEPPIPVVLRVLEGSADVRATPSAVVGILRSEEATILVDLDTIHVNAARDISNGTAIARMWARTRLNELAMDRDRNAAQITAVGRQFSIVTPGTSLIVLDRVEDYVRFGIAPPSSEPQLVEQYQIRRKSMVDDSARRYASHFEYVVDVFQTRKAWWDAVHVEPEMGSKRGALDFHESVVGRGANAGAVSSSDVRADVAMEVAVQSNGNLTRLRQGSGSMELANPLDPVKSKPQGYVSIDSINQIILTKPVSNAAYMTSIKAAKDPYTEYLAQREQFGSSPAFYLDVADHFRELKKNDLALRILSNIAELTSEDPRLLRILAYRLMQLGYADLAVLIFEDVLKMREEEPQSHRDLGLAYAAAKRPQDAVQCLYTLATRPWDARFPEVELIALNEMNRVIAEAGKGVDTSGIDQRLIAAMPVDVRVVLSWDADDCDMDLWVTDPRGEKCLYNNRNTKIGGHLSCDLTGGYGPEEFLLKQAVPGEYKVAVNYFGDRQQRLAGATTIYVDLYTNYGKPNEQKQSVILKVEATKQVLEVGSLKIGG